MKKSVQRLWGPEWRQKCLQKNREKIYQEAFGIWSRSGATYEIDTVGTVGSTDRETN